ncbi:MAG: hypothetical protein QOG67_3677 [Verrucomicrobiota bacterium]|jgi:hypothetical protein
MAGRNFGCEKTSVCCRQIVSIAPTIQGAQGPDRQIRKGKDAVFKLT